MHLRHLTGSLGTDREMNTAVGLLEAPLRLLLSRFELRSCFGGGSSTSNSGIKEEGNPAAHELQRVEAI